MPPLVEPLPVALHTNCHVVELVPRRFLEKLVDVVDHRGLEARPDQPRRKTLMSARASAELRVTFGLLAVEILCHLTNLLFPPQPRGIRGSVSRHMTCIVCLLTG